METRLILPGCPAYLDRDGSKRCGLPAEVRCRFMLSSAEREAAVKAAAIEVPVTGLPQLSSRRLAAPITAAVALVLAVTAALIFVAVVRGLAAAPGGHRTRTPIVVPHPTPGPFGS
jgi:hypothetical protein